MANTDLVADMFTRIRNANTVFKENTEVPLKRVNEQILRIFKKEGFIKDYHVIRGKNRSVIRIFLKYGARRERAITGLRRISKPGLRHYVSKDRIPRFFGGLALVVLTTSKGILTDKEARKQGIGGEVICCVW